MKILTIVIRNEPTRFKIETQRTFHGTNVCLRNVGCLGLLVVGCANKDLRLF